MKKHALGAMVASVALFVAGCGGGFLLNDLADVANRFFAAAGAGEWDAAEALLAEDFKASVNRAQLQAFIEGTRLTGFEKASWPSRKVESGQGMLEGTVTASGGSVPLVVTLVKAGDAWKILRIDKAVQGGLSPTAAPDLPSESEQVQLVRDSIRQFAESVNAKSMAAFHGRISELWKSQYTVAQLDEAYKVFFDLGQDLTVLNEFSPVFNAPASINEDGVMAVEGHYPTQPNQVNFGLKYILEGTAWKLVGFHLQIK